MKFIDYYNKYWIKRGISQSEAIPNAVPVFLARFTSYGAIRSVIPENSKILDLGCGDGSVSHEYIKRGEVYGLDISKIAVKAANKNNIKAKIHNLNEYPYPFGKNQFDVCILTDVLEHLIDIQATLHECKRVLKKGGKIIITVPNFARFSNRLRMLAGDPIDILHFDRYGDDVEHLHWFTVPKLRHIAKKAGFSTIRFVPTGLQNFNFIFGILKIPQFGKFITCVLE